jgi:hypothetical protein
LIDPEFPNFLAQLKNLEECPSRNYFVDGDSGAAGIHQGCLGFHLTACLIPHGRWKHFSCCEFQAELALPNGYVTDLVHA